MSLWSKLNSMQPLYTIITHYCILYKELAKSRLVSGYTNTQRVGFQDVGEEGMQS